MDRLKGLVSVITGAGSGIGRASALAFAAEGACVVAADLNLATAEETSRAIGSQGGSSSAFEVDVSDAAQVGAMLQHAVEKFGRLDVLFNNAGLPQAATPLEDSDGRALRAHHGRQRPRRVQRLPRGDPTHEGPGRRRHPEHGQHGWHPSTALLAIYNASKAAVISLTKTLALEVAPYRIRVVSICPVATDTPMLSTFLGRTGRRS